MITVMREYLLTIVVIALCTGASAQVSTKFTELEHYMQEHGLPVSYEQRNVGEGIEHVRSASFWITHLRVTGLEKEAGSQHALDSIDAMRNKPLLMALDSIRRTFSALAAVASESYMYEYHKEERDTIEYSIAFVREDGDSVLSWKNNNAVVFRNMREVGRLHYHNSIHPTGTYGTAHYWHTYYEHNPLTWEQLKDFDTGTFFQLIQPLFKKVLKEKGVKSYPIYWRHDEGYQDGLSGNLQYKMTWYHDDGEENKHTGETTGTHYLIPKEKETLALKLLHSLDSVSFAYVNAHPEQLYRYRRCDRYNTGSWATMVSGSVHKRNKDRDYELNVFLDEQGFHLVSITTLGELWVPRDWQSLKSWINGQGTFLKGHGASR